MTVYAIMAAAAAFANLVGSLSVGTPRHDLYFLFVAEEHLYLASLLGLGSAIIPVLGFWTVARIKSIRSLAQLLPPVTGHVGDHSLVIGCVALSAVSIAAQIALDFKFASSLMALLALFPCMSAFVLARAAAARRVRGAMAIGFLIVIAESARAFFLSYLRASIAFPYFSYACGAWLGSRSLRPLFRIQYLFVYAAALWYIANYGVLGEIRENAPQGIAKMEYMLDYKEQLRGNNAKPKQTFMSRLSTINQLSQIGRIVEEDGFYNGTTLSYFTFAFIPRFLWPEKPYIERGSWFAVRIGQATETTDGWYNNTINMTQAGEFYLNFGWLGVFAGLLAYGAFFGVLWTAAAFTDSRNVLGGAFGYFLVWSMLGQHGDLAIVVTTIAMYLLFLAMSLAANGVELLKRLRAKRREVTRYFLLPDDYATQPRAVDAAEEESVLLAASASRLHLQPTLR